MLEKLHFLLDEEHKKKTINIIIIFVLIVILPLVVVTALRQQELRQRAAETPATPPYPSDILLTINPQSATPAPQSTFTADIVISDPTNMSGIDFTVNFNPAVLEIQTFTPGNSNLSDILIQEKNNQQGTFRFAAVNPSGTPTGVSIGRITFFAKASGVSSVTFTNVQLTAIGNPNAVIPTLTQATYSVQIPEVTIALTPTKAPLIGDIDGNGSIDILDYNQWRNDFVKKLAGTNSDINKDGKIDLLDFNLWLTAFRKQYITPTPSTTNQRF